MPSDSELFPKLAAGLREAQEMAWYARWLQRVRQQQANRAVLHELGASQADIARLEHEAAVAALTTPEERELEYQIDAALADGEDQDQ